MRRERYPVARGEQAQAFYGAGLSELTTYLTTCQAPFPCLFQTCTYFPTSGEAAPEAGTMVHEYVPVSTPRSPLTMTSDQVFRVTGASSCNLRP